MMEEEEEEEEHYSAEFGHIDRLVEITSLLTLMWNVKKHHEALEMVRTWLEITKQSKEDKHREYVGDVMIFMIRRLEARLTRGLDPGILDPVIFIEECCDSV